jgi:hypothetical protein
VVESEPSAPDRGPVYLVVAALLVAIQAAGLLALAVLELASLSGDRLALGITTALFFAAVALGVGVCALGLTHARSWARGPVVATELLQLLTAWSFRDNGSVALVLAGLAIVVLVCVLHPASNRAFEASES